MHQAGIHLPVATSPSSDRFRGALAGAAGNLLEWYDFAAYGYFSAIIGRSFFPSDTAYVSLLSAFAVFAAAFFMRPIGGIVFGHIGDRFGPKRALFTSAVVMTLSTFAIGCLPTYETAGVLAPVLLVLLRLGQGMSVGGEYTASAAYLVSSSAPEHRGLMGSLTPLGATSGIMVGSLTGVVISDLLTPSEVEAWGWRLPFLLGISLGLFVLVLRSRMQSDTVPASTGRQAQKLPLREAFRTDAAAMLRAFLATLILAGGFYLIFIYLVTYLQTQGGADQHEAFVINTASMLVMLMCLPLYGILSDRIGRKLVLTIQMIGVIVLSIPLFALISSHLPIWIMLGQIGFAVLLAGIGGVIPSMLMEAFSSQARNTAMAISYNAAMALVGGTAPMVATALMARTQNPMTLAYYMMGLSLLSLIGVLALKDRTGKPLTGNSM
ncbi:MAG TPA: MFS transporter [Geminicoccus sp.]|jgi:MHS family proline/betaine transporter-like MFS transporter|uniref:MFS transporter n=1 Tax=Geminicoccus sp. TaxID=2024832 RepID=UPI002E30679A|nr:MFS transporter [Geminicoccus sp.]HEX2524809.1 MFS transporter [Geminicoccus sp.]